MTKVNGGTSDTVPAYMAEYAGEGMENITIDDTGWCGLDGNVDSIAVLKEHGYDRQVPLELILGALIKARQPLQSEKRDSERERERLETTLAAISGTSRKRGNDEKDDYPLLLAIAKRYYAEFFECPGEAPELTPIIRACIGELSPKDPRRHMADLSSVVKRLRDKFNADSDLLLARVTFMDTYDRMHVRQASRQILLAMRKLGITVDLSVLEVKRTLGI